MPFCRVSTTVLGPTKGVVAGIAWPLWYILTANRTRSWTTCHGRILQSSAWGREVAVELAFHPQALLLLYGLQVFPSGHECYLVAATGQQPAEIPPNTPGAHYCDFHLILGSLRVIFWGMSPQDTTFRPCGVELSGWEVLTRSTATGLPNSARRSRFSTFPMAFLGNSSTKTTERGLLNPANLS